jgi:hypothetical protein
MNLEPAYIEVPWLIFVAYWFVAGFWVNKMERREPAGSLAARILVMVPAIASCSATIRAWDF